MISGLWHEVMPAGSGLSNFERVNECWSRSAEGALSQIGQWFAEESFNRTIADTPILADLMSNARREWPVRVEKDFSYSASALRRSLDSCRGCWIVSRPGILDWRFNRTGIRHRSRCSPSSGVFKK
jgi:hypothetical protein